MAAIHAKSKTFFQTIRRSFVDVPVDAAHDNAIATGEFLEAADSLTTLFDQLGSVAFTPVKNDMLGNIKKVRDRQLASPTDSQSLQSLVLSELKTKKHTATEGLLWLVRGLDFTAQALRDNQTHPSTELSTSFRTAYNTTLKPHHSWVVKPIFSAAMSATPYRKDFYAKIGVRDGGEGQEGIGGQEELRRWLEALEKQVGVLKEFLGRRDVKL
ncbi:glycolipid transfer protein het-c2 [Lasallia pustulata]|uniref:Glycolipid transfer protein het-c2 n=1 Tax=Lasallia pustulata TaxID=136370 RepID=A0A1W5CZS7_9LECA|nr:glycolipid transfer protein het-c2 [Lasallia pustulata]